MKYVNAIVVEFKNLGWEMRRYYFNTFAMFIVLLLAFLGLFYGIKTISGNQIDNRSLDSMVVGYVLWTSSIAALTVVGGVVEDQSRHGTLEQLYLSSISAGVIFLIKGWVSTIFNFVLITVILFVVMLITGRMLAINYLQFYLLLFVSLLALNGIGLMLGGVGLTHKKVRAVTGIFSFALIGLMLLPVYPITVFTFFPFIAGAYTINRSIVEGSSFPFWWYILITGLSFAYLFTGIVVFRLFEKKARRLNKLAQY
jgi:ABC-2 type transport system permease protein